MDRRAARQADLVEARLLGGFGRYWARQIVDLQLKDYCTTLVGESVSCAETLLDRAVQMHELKAA